MECHTSYARLYVRASMALRLPDVAAAAGSNCLTFAGFSLSAPDSIPGQCRVFFGRETEEAVGGEGGRGKGTRNHCGTDSDGEAFPKILIVFNIRVGCG